MLPGYQQNNCVNKHKGHVALKQKYLKKQDCFNAHFKKNQVNKLPSAELSPLRPCLRHHHITGLQQTNFK